MDIPLIIIGKVVSAHGLNGEIKVYPYSDFPGRCHQLRDVRINKSGEISVREVEYARVQGNIWVIKLKEYDSREEAEALRGLNLYILPEERIELPPDSYYYDEIIGLEVYSAEGDFLGIIKEILPSGGQDTYVVADKDSKKDILIPAAKEIIREVDIRRSRMTADLPEGLRDL